jgi:hypothetical protein
MADKLWDFIQRLRDRTTEGKVSWERTADEGVYQVSFPNYTVRIFSRPAGEEEFEYVVQIVDQEGTVVEEATNGDLAAAATAGRSSAYRLMGDLFKQARRKAMGVDQALDAIMESLGPGPDHDVPF